MNSHIGNALVLAKSKSELGGRSLMKTGTIKWFNSRKGYGFIKPVDGGFDVYIDISAVKRAGLTELKEGQEINFDIVADDRSGEVFAENLSVPLNNPGDTHGNTGEPRRVPTTVRIVGQLTRQIAQLPLWNDPVVEP
jgi:CspA family cold shock protein